MKSKDTRQRESCSLPREVYSRAEAAHVLGTSTWTIDRWARAKVIKVLRTGMWRTRRHYVIPRSEIQRLLNGSNTAEMSGTPLDPSLGGGRAANR